VKAHDPTNGQPKPFSHPISHAFLRCAQFQAENKKTQKKSIFTLKTAGDKKVWSKSVEQRDIGLRWELAHIIEIRNIKGGNQA